MFSALLTGVVETSSALELSQYNKLDTVSRIVNDSEVTDNLRTLLGNHYQTFIDNFDVFGEPHTTTGGGLFVEGWLKDLYQENASALVINPDGKIFAAWVVPGTDVIQYWSSDNSPVIHADIQQWAASFNALKGKTLHDSAGKIIGSTYKNGEIVYTVTYVPVKLFVSKGNHVLVEQSGQ